jgi:folate-binding Fe-S cluster repair protein YgfZ
LPAEAAVYTHIAFDKGCYVGQEVHARQHYRGHANRKLVAVRVPEESAASLRGGASLYLDGEEAGRLTSFARLARPAREGGTERSGIALVRHTVAASRPLLAARRDAQPSISVGPLATDLGAAKR